MAMDLAADWRQGRGRAGSSLRRVAKDSKARVKRGRVGEREGGREGLKEPR